MFAVLATNQNWGIAKSQPTGSPKMPWHSSADFQIFRALTLNHVCLASSSTFLSLPRSVQTGPKRTFKLLTSQPQAGNELTFNQALCLPHHQTKKWALIGGLKAYHQLMGICQTAYVTTIQDQHDCDYKLNPSCLGHFGCAIRLLDYTPADPTQPSISLDVYLKTSCNIPKPLIDCLDKLRAESK
jgi:dihydrofolate reductase